MRKLLAILSCLACLSGCADLAGDDLTVFPSAIWFEDAPGLDNRHAYEITGPGWKAEHRIVTDRVWGTGLRPRTDVNGRVAPNFDEPAPYTAGTPMHLRARFDAAFAPDVDLDAHVRAVGTLRSTTDPTIGVREILHWEDDIERTDGSFPMARIESAPLPRRVDVWELDIRWTVTSEVDTQTFRTTHVVPTTWRDPMPDAPLYKRLLLWSSTWAAGEWTDAGPGQQATADSIHRITSKLLYGTRTLEDKGRSYGRFPRPDRDRIDDRANVWLDFSRSACGEWRGALMALVETQGINASWVWFKFPDPDDEDDEAYWHPGVYTHYRTREIAAVGRRARRWVNTNHIVVKVNGRIYDPTYTVIKDSWGEYEDWMFAEYCKTDRARPRDRDCVPNPPGYDKGDDIHPRVIFADNYR